MPDVTPGRHRAVKHRGPSRYEQARDRVCDRIIDVHDALPSRRSLAVGAVGGVLATGAVVGVQAVVGGTTDDLAAKPLDSASVVTALERSGAGDVSRDLARPPLADKVTDPEAVEQARREAVVAERKAAQQAKAAAAAEKEKAEAEKRKAALASADPREIAQAMLSEYGWGADQFGCLDSLWVGESGWNPSAANPSSGAYGIPQALPGSKMASAGSDWQTNPATQIRWGLGYIQDRYGTPCGAESFKQGNGWY